MATAFHLNSNNFLLDTFSVFVELSLDPVTYSSFVSQSLGFICLLLMEIWKYTQTSFNSDFIESLVLIRINLDSTYVAKLKINK